MKHTNGAGRGTARPAEVEEVNLCHRCNGSGWVSKRVHVGHPEFGQAFPCVCQETQNVPTRITALRRYSNLGALARITFANTRPEGPPGGAANRQMFADAYAFAAAYAESPEGWLVLSGPSGSGKTHLAAAIANQCIERQQTTFFIVAADLLDHLRATYSPESPVTYDELFEQVRNVPLLVLDDLGTTSATPWAEEKLFQVVNHRYNNALPTVITVRGPMQRMDDALRTRLEGFNGFSRVWQLGYFNNRPDLDIGAVPDSMLSRMTFDNFDPHGGQGATRTDQESLAEALGAARSFAADPEGWLLFTGPWGSGKTHLAVAIAGVSLLQDRPVFFAFVPTLMDHLRATFRPDSVIGYDELFEQLITVPLLVLDDLGTESSTPWAEEKLYQIIVHRHESNLPTVITTASDMEELRKTKPRLAARLVDINVVNDVPITAPNYRDQGRGSASGPVEDTPQPGGARQRRRGNRPGPR